ncbi:acyltransferase [Plantactinospora sp. BB1]|nr:acyltransferase [Plantactinospora sp. BB1]
MEGAVAVHAALPAAATRPPAGHPSRNGGFRRDIEGLRAVAVLLVVLYHARVPLLGGGYVGVDVFYVISGFVVTTVLLREFATSGSISLPAFYARRARRLLPAAVLTLLVTLVASWLWLPLQTQWIAKQAAASATYSLNFLLAMNNVDYLDAMRRESPLEHFWSLAVEEQFYLVWPLLLIALFAWRLGRRGNRGRGTGRPDNGLPLLIGVGTVAVLSFAFGAWLTIHSPGYAYFVTPARAWELAVGALVALTAGTLAGIPGRVAAVMTWAGLAAVAAAALLFDASTQFPGYAALLPVTGVALVIAGGCSAPAGGAAGLLSTGVLQWIGRLSYSWYLWHWPFLILGPAIIGGAGSLGQNLGLAAAALAAAAITYALVENPIRRLPRLESKPRRTLGLAVASSGLVLAVALPMLLLRPTVVGPGAPVDTAATLSSASSAEEELVRLVAASAEATAVPANLSPALPDVTADTPTVFRDGCVVLKITDTAPARPCVYGDPAARQTVVLFGDSHAGSWFPALDEIAQARGWRLVVMVKGFCSAASVRFRLDSIDRPFDECVEWRRNMLEWIADLRPALVVTSSTDFTFGEPVDSFIDRDQVWTDGWIRTLEELGSHAGEVVLINDTPWLPATVLDCLARHLTDARRCHAPVRDAQLEPRRRAMIAAAATQRGVTVIDPTPWFCTASVCPALIGNVVTLRDGNHMPAAYSRLLWRVLDERIGPRLGM